MSRKDARPTRSGPLFRALLELLAVNVATGGSSVGFFSSGLVLPDLDRLRHAAHPNGAGSPRVGSERPDFDRPGVESYVGMALRRMAVALQPELARLLPDDDRTRRGDPWELLVLCAWDKAARRDLLPLRDVCDWPLRTRRRPHLPGTTPPQHLMQLVARPQPHTHDTPSSFLLTTSCQPKP